MAAPYLRIHPKNECAFDRVLQFPYVSWIVVLSKGFLCFGREHWMLNAHILRETS